MSSPTPPAERERAADLAEAAEVVGVIAGYDPKPGS